MPTYDYECAGCGHSFELFQPITAKPVKRCPRCGQLRARRLIGTGGGIIFKGAGFYETDYRSEDYKKAAKADKEASSGDKKDKSDQSTDKKDKSDQSTDKKAASKSGKPAPGEAA